MAPRRPNDGGTTRSAASTPPIDGSRPTAICRRVGPNPDRQGAAGRILPSAPCVLALAPRSTVVGALLSLAAGRARGALRHNRRAPSARHPLRRCRPLLGKPASSAPLATARAAIVSGSLAWPVSPRRERSSGSDDVSHFELATVYPYRRQGDAARPPLTCRSEATAARCTWHRACRTGMHAEQHKGDSDESDTTDRDHRHRSTGIG